MSADANSSEETVPFDEDHCRRFVAKHPKSAEARFNLAQALVAADDPAEAVEQCTKALALQPKMRAPARLLASLLQRYALNASIDVTPRGLEAAFAFIDVDRQALGNAAIAYLKARAPLRDILACGRTDGWNAAAGLLPRKGQKLLKDRLFIAALTHSVITDIEVEFLLTAFRKHLLLEPDILTARIIYEFVCTIIRQCHNNGHVYFTTQEEQSALKSLSPNIDKVLQGRTDDVGSLLLLALYKPLHRLIGISLAKHRFDKVSPRALRPVLAACLESKQYEIERADSIPELTAITDETSRQVAAQYQEDPYPQWLSLQTPEPGSALLQLQDNFPRVEVDRIAGPCDVLIAGAGTGQQAISSAIAYGPKARVLAIDLSAPSLAYGERMAHALNADNIRFARADILHLADVNECYDVIECCGVLHHMTAPYAAWRRLIDRLRPGGLMHIGLYSAVSRGVIENLAKDPDWPGPNADDVALRTFRHVLMCRGSGELGFELTNSVDFYTKSGFRDLALHVSEKRCTIPEIRDFMAANDLEFRGFLLPPEIIDAYRARFPMDELPGMLDHWAEYEDDNPRTFDGMYLFWCRSNRQK